MCSSDLLFAEDSTGPRVVATYSPPAIAAGEILSGIEFDLEPGDVGVYGVSATVDVEDSVSECVETNNSDEYSEAWCE